MSPSKVHYALTGLLLSSSILAAPTWRDNCPFGICDNGDGKGPRDIKPAEPFTPSSTAPLHLPSDGVGGNDILPSTPTPTVSLFPPAIDGEGNHATNPTATLTDPPFFPQDVGGNNETPPPTVTPTDHSSLPPPSNEREGDNKVPTAHFPPFHPINNGTRPPHGNGTMPPNGNDTKPPQGNGTMPPHNNGTRPPNGDNIVGPKPKPKSPHIPTPGVGEKIIHWLLKLIFHANQNATPQAYPLHYCQTGDSTYCCWKNCPTCEPYCKRNDGYPESKFPPGYIPPEWQKRDEHSSVATEGSDLAKFTREFSRMSKEGADSEKRGYRPAHIRPNPYPNTTTTTSATDLLPTSTATNLPDPSTDALPKRAEQGYRPAPIRPDPYPDTTTSAIGAVPTSTIESSSSISRRDALPDGRCETFATVHGHEFMAHKNRENVEPNCLPATSWNTECFAVPKGYLSKGCSICANVCGGRGCQMTYIAIGPDFKRIEISEVTAQMIFTKDQIMEGGGKVQWGPPGIDSQCHKLALPEDNRFPRWPDKYGQKKTLASTHLVSNSPWESFANETGYVNVVADMSGKASLVDALTPAPASNRNITTPVPSNVTVIPAHSVTTPSTNSTTSALLPRQAQPPQADKCSAFVTVGVPRGQPRRNYDHSSPAPACMFYSPITLDECMPHDPCGICMRACGNRACIDTVAMVFQRNWGERDLFYEIDYLDAMALFKDGWQREKGGVIEMDTYEPIYGSNPLVHGAEGGAPLVCGRYPHGKVRLPGGPVNGVMLGLYGI